MSPGLQDQTTGMKLRFALEGSIISICSTLWDFSPDWSNQINAIPDMLMLEVISSRMNMLGQSF